MIALSKTVIQKFCDICNWTHEAWCSHKTLFDVNPNVNALVKGNCGEFFSRLSIITQEYSLLQIAKLHDPPVMGGNICLTIGYIIDYGGWEKETYDKLNKLQDSMEYLRGRIKPARNKLLSHHDLKTIINKSTLGAFEEGADVEYFKALEEFVNIVHDKCIGGPFPFDTLAINDCEIIINKILAKEAT